MLSGGIEPRHVLRIGKLPILNSTESHKPRLGLLCLPELVKPQAERVQPSRIVPSSIILDAGLSIGANEEVLANAKPLIAIDLVRGESSDGLAFVGLDLLHVANHINCFSHL